jgi:hypothetical protein
MTRPAARQRQASLAVCPALGPGKACIQNNKAIGARNATADRSLG